MTADLIRARSLGVVGASGGVGTSSFAAALAALAARQGLVVACCDAGPGRGGIDVFFDGETRDAVRWADLARARGGVDGAALLGLLPQADGVAVLAAAPGGGPGPEDPGEVVRALGAHVDLLVLDLGTDPATPLPLDDLVLVGGYTVPALAATAAVAERVATGPARRAWLAQRCPRGRADLAEQVAARVDLPLLAALVDDARLDERLARGETPGLHGGRLADAAALAVSGLAAQVAA